MTSDFARAAGMPVKIEPLPAKLIHLPYPPTTNGLFKNAGRGRVRTDKYNAWIKEGWSMIVQQRPQKITGEFYIFIRAVRPDKRRRDIDNLIKPVLDLLVKAQIVADDSDCLGVTALWSALEPAGVWVSLAAA